MSIRLVRSSAAALLSFGLSVYPLRGVSAQKPARSAADIDDIATLVMLEDRREYDSTALARILSSSHPEVRRRAAVAIGRIAAPTGRGARRVPVPTALLKTRFKDRD